MASMHLPTIRKSGSLALPFETVLDKVGQADFWIFGYYGNFNKQQLLAEYPGYAALKPFKTDEIYGCQIDRRPISRRLAGVQTGFWQT